MFSIIEVVESWTQWKQFRVVLEIETSLWTVAGIADCPSAVDAADVFRSAGISFRSGIATILWNCGMLGDLHDYMALHGVSITDGARGAHFQDTYHTGVIHAHHNFAELLPGLFDHF